MSGIDEVIERLRGACDDRPNSRISADVGALLADHARLRAEADALRIIAERRLELIRATLANSEWRHGARNIYAELSKELSAAMGADA